MNKSKLPIAGYIIYLLLIAGIVWESFAIVKGTNPFFKQRQSLSFHKVNVDGNVRKPGWYVVPEGVTQFEILKVAGVRGTSDLSAADLSSPVTDNSNIRVGTLDKPVAVKRSATSARLEHFVGEVNIVSFDGISVPKQDGIIIKDGDRIQTQGESQAELSIGGFSKMSIDNFSEVVLEKIASEENGRVITHITQNAGASWYRIAADNRQEIYRIFTSKATISIGAAGADFLIDVQNDHIVIDIMDGLILIEKIAGNESINLISGQSALIFDDGRPIQVSRLSPDISASQRFSTLAEPGTGDRLRNKQINFLFSVSPGIYYLVNIHVGNKKINLIRIHEQMLIEQFAQGITTIHQAYLYGGASFVTTFLERVFDTRIQKYFNGDKDNIVRIAQIVGGINVDVDSKAAKFLNLSRGRQKISGPVIQKYLSPAISGVADSKERQTQVLRNLFDDLRLKNIALTMLSADQVVNSAETNFSAYEFFEMYTTFNTHSEWTLNESMIPSNIVNRSGKMYYDPILDECRRLVKDEEM